MKWTILNAVFAAVIVFFGVVRPMMDKEPERQEVSYTEVIDVTPKYASVEEVGVDLKSIDQMATIKLGEQTFNFICKKPSSFDELAVWVKSAGDDILWLDLGMSNDVDTRANSDGFDLAESLDSRLNKIYNAEGWSVESKVVQDNSEYGVTKRGAQSNIPAIVYFIKVEDVDWLKSPEGLNKVAREILAWAVNSKKKNIVLTIKGFKDFGSGSESIDGYTEEDYTFDLYTIMTYQLTRVDSAKCFSL